MDVRLLKTDILSNNIPNFLIFIDNNSALVRQYINGIGNTINKKPTYFDDTKSAFKDLLNPFSEDVLYVLYNDKMLNSDECINELIKFKDKNVIVLLESIDKRTSFYKNYCNYIVEFNKFDSNALLAYSIKLCKDHRCVIDQNKLIDLINFCDNDLGILLNELDKIFILEQDNSNILVDYMLNNAFSDYRKFNIDDFIYKVLHKDLSAFELLYKINDSTVGIINILYTAARKKFLESKNDYYCKLMKSCSHASKLIMSKHIDQSYALKLILLSVL